MHELGHHELRKDWDIFNELLPVVARAEKHHHEYKSNRYKRRNSYIVGCLEEEFKAWDEGLKLARYFDIRIDLEKWNEFRSICLKAYIIYYSDFKNTNRMNLFQEENDVVERQFEIQEVLEFTSKHDVQIIRGEDYQYGCYINKECYFTGLTPIYSLWFGVKCYNERNKINLVSKI